MLKPIDIQEKDFEIKMRGYDRDQVDDFLDEIIDTFDILYKTNKSLQQRVDALEKEAADAANARESLELVRYQCDEMKKSAREEADSIINNAKNSVGDVEKGIEIEYLKKKEMILNIKQNLADFKNNVRSNCNDIMAIVDKME